MVDVGQGSSRGGEGDGAGERIQFVECSPCEHEDLWFIPSTTLGGDLLATSRPVCNPSTGEAEPGQIPGTCRPALLTWVTSRPMRGPASKHRVEGTS